MSSDLRFVVVYVSFMLCLSSCIGSSTADTHGRFIFWLTLQRIHIDGGGGVPKAGNLPYPVYVAKVKRNTRSTLKHDVHELWRQKASYEISCFVRMYDRVPYRIIYNTIVIDTSSYRYAAPSQVPACLPV